MLETYDSVMDRIGAFNLATESLSKARVREVRVALSSRPDCGLRLVKTAVSYDVEVDAAAISNEGDQILAGLGFTREGTVLAREVRKSERSWTVASQLEDILEEVFGLPNDGAITVETL